MKITALIGWMVFSESLPGTWWLGAGLLVAGNVVIGMRDDGTAKTPAGEPAYETVGTEEPEDDQDGHDLPSIRDRDSE